MAEYAIKWTQGGKEAFNIVEVLEGANGPNGALPDPGYAAQYAGESVAAKLGKTLMDALEDRISVNTSLEQVTELGVMPNTATIARDGMNAQFALPINCAYLVQKNPTSGRRGRMFVPGVTESGTSSAGINSTATLLLWETSLNDWVWRMKAEQIFMLVKRTIGPSSLIQSFALDAVIGLQGDRMGK